MILFLINWSFFEKNNSEVNIDINCVQPPLDSQDKELCTVIPTLI